MEIKRKPFQGVWNIIRFNLHFFYVAALTILILGYMCFTDVPFSWPLLLIISTAVLLPLVTSWYVYDISDLYRLIWIENSVTSKQHTVVNINAGFDEITPGLKQLYGDANVITLDFFDPVKHTEKSILRARKAYAPSPEIQHTKTTTILLDDDSIDYIFIFLAAHEIRNHTERVLFFSEIKRIIKPEGKIFITEHLRDLPNFIAYNIGFFHFHSWRTWSDTFTEAGLMIEKEVKNTPFISTFTITKNGNTY